MIVQRPSVNSFSLSPSFAELSKSKIEIKLILANGQNFIEDDVLSLKSTYQSNGPYSTCPLAAQLSTGHLDYQLHIRGAENNNNLNSTTCHLPAFDFRVDFTTKSILSLLPLSAGPTLQIATTPWLDNRIKEAWAALEEGLFLRTHQLLDETNITKWDRLMQRWLTPQGSLSLFNIRKIFQSAYRWV